MSKKMSIIVALLILLLAGAAIVGYPGLTYYNVRKKPNFSKQYTLYVYPDMPESEILDSLSSGAGMKVRAYMEKALESEEGSVLPGKYVVSPNDPSIYVARMLKRGCRPLRC